MGELTERSGDLPGTLDSYVQQGQMFLFNIAQNLLQFGRVLVEAKPLVPRGQFEGWVQKSFGISERTAQQYMATWRRFGNREQFQTVKFSSLQKMLSLPEGAEERFAEENDLEAMTAREVEKAVQETKAAMQSELQREKNARKDAERRADQAEAKSGQLPDSVKAAIAEKDAALVRSDAEIKRLTREIEQASREKKEAQDDLQEVQELLEENQREYNRMQSELLNAQSAIARGDAERVVSDQLTVEDFSAAVRGFLGSVSQMPYMHTTFSQIADMREYRQWDELLRAVEGWTVQARKALNHTEIRGEIIG